MKSMFTALLLVFFGSSSAHALGQTVVAFSCVGENGIRIIMDGQSLSAVATMGATRSVFQVAPSVIRVQQGIGPISSLIQLQIPGSRATGIYDIELDGELRSGAVMLATGRLMYSPVAPIMAPTYPGPMRRSPSVYQPITNLFCQVLVR